MYGWFDLNHCFLDRLRPERLTSNQMVTPIFTTHFIIFWRPMSLDSLYVKYLKPVFLEYNNVTSKLNNLRCSDYIKRIHHQVELYQEVFILSSV